MLADIWSWAKYQSQADAIAIIGCWYQSQGRGRPVAGPSKCPPLGVIPTWVKDVESYGVGSLTLLLLVIPKYFILAVLLV